MAGPWEDFARPAESKAAPWTGYARRPVAGAEPPAVAKKPERTWGQAAKDTGLGAVQGVVNILGGLAEQKETMKPTNLARQAVRVAGSMGLPNAEKVLAKIPGTLMERQFDQAPGSGSAALSSAIQGVSETIGSGQSAALRQEKQDLANTEGFWGSAKKVVTSPQLLGNFVAEQVPNLLTMGTGTRVAAGRAAAGALARGLSTEVAEAAGKKAATRAATGITTMMETGSAGQQAYQQAMAQPEDVWQANAEYQRMLAAGVDPVTAKETMARGSSMKAQAITAPIAAGAGAIAAPFEADVFTRRLARKPAAVLGGIAREGVEETLQEGGSQFAGNVGVRDVNPDQGVWEGVPEAAGTGAALGAVLGGGMAGAGAAVSQERTARRPQPTIEPAGEITSAADPSTAATVVPSPAFPDAAPGSLASAANAMPQGRMAVKPRAQSAEPPPIPAHGEVAPPNTGPEPPPIPIAGKRGPDVSPPPPPRSPWTDPETGEYREPSTTQIKAAIHERLNAQATRGVNPYAIKKALGLEANRFHAAWFQVQKERREGFTGPVEPEADTAGGSDAGALDSGNGSVGAAAEPAVANVADSSANAPAEAPAVDTALEAPRADIDVVGETATQPSTGAPQLPTEQPAIDVSSLPPEHANDWEEGKARPVQNPGVQGVDERGGSVPEPEQPSPSQLRGAGDQAPPGMGAELPGVPEGGRQEADGESHAGEDGQQSGISAGELEVGDPEGASQQPAQDALADARGQDAVTDGLGGGVGARPVDSPVPLAAGENDGAGGLDDTAPQRPQATAAPVLEASSQAATSPDNDLPDATPAQRDAGNFKVGRLKVNGHDISIEYPAGVKRKPEHKELTRSYGYIRRTEANDGEKVDVFLGERADDTSLPVFVIDQVDAAGKYDEAKVVMGEATENDARAAYLSNYPDGWTGMGGITQLTQDEFKAWVNDPTKTKKRLSPIKRGGPAIVQPKPGRTAAQSTGQAASAPRVRVKDGKAYYDTSHLDTLEAYFQPGRVVASYGGHDRVLAFTAEGGSAKDWSVRVIGVNADGSPKQGEVERVHHTTPSAAELIKALGKPVPKQRKPATSKAPAALFSKTNDRQRFGIARAQALKTELIKSWGDDAPSVILIEDASGFPASAKADPEYRRAEGMYDGRAAVWINLANITSEERFGQVLAHEAIGHYGVERIVGKGEWNQIVDAIEALDRGNVKPGAATAAVLADVHQRYGNLDRVTFAKEAIAVMAERGIRNSFVDRVASAVRRFLRKWMPTMSWSEADVRDLLSQSDSFLRAGRDAEQRAQTVQAYSFSQTEKPAELRPDQAEATAYRTALAKLVQDRRTTVAPIKVGNTSQVLQLLGAAELPITLERDVVRKATNGVKHDVPMSVIEQLPELLADPLAVFASRADAGGLAVVLEALDGTGRPVMVAIHLEKAQNRLKVNRIASAYGRPESQYQVWTKEGLLRYLADTKNPDLVRLVGLQLPVSGSPDQGSVSAGPGRLMQLYMPASGSPNQRSGRKILSRSDVVKSDPQFSRPLQDGLGRAYIDQQGGRFIQMGNAWYLADADGKPQDFLTRGEAEAEAKRTGGQIEADPNEGARRTWSVVLPNGAELSRDAGRAFFSKPAADTLADIEAVQQGIQADGVLARARQMLADAVPKKLKDATRPTWLGALTTRHLTELAGDYFKNSHIYSEYLANMAADRNKMQSDADAIAEPARKWLGKNRAEAEKLFKLMHEATIDGVDPSEEYQPLQFRYSGKLWEVNRKNIRAAQMQIRQQIRERSGDSKANLYAESKALSLMAKAEPRRKRQYAPLVEQWIQLPQEARGIYKQFRDAYTERSNAVEQALVDRINDIRSDAFPDSQKRIMVHKIRQQFEANRLQGVYFPLQRFGQFFVAATKADTSTFMMFETLADLERGVAGLKSKGWDITSRGLKSEGKAKDAPSGTFVAEVMTKLNRAGVSEQTQDSIYQLYLQSMPEMSMRKHQIHRKAVPGFDPDGVRAFAYNMHHGSHQIARMRYSHKLEASIEMLKTQQKGHSQDPNADTRKIAAGDAILGELDRRHEWIMNPTDSQLTNLVSSAGFVYYLGATPAAALVNLTQTALVAYPYLASRFGAIKAMNYLLATARDTGRTLGNIQKTLTDPDEQQAYVALELAGSFTKTQAHNLAGIAEGGMLGYNPAWSKAMEVIGWGFHKTEVMNREATGMAAYRLARAEGQSFAEAVQFALDANADTHFDYSNANRARFMQSGTAKVLLMFRQYSLNMTWHLGRMVWQATKGQSPEVKKLARRNLAGILGMSSLFSGVLGLPAMGVVMGLLNAAQASFGDDDEPWDAETEFRSFMTDMLGRDAAGLVLRGGANKLTGADIAGRTGLSAMWFRDADRELEGRGLYNHLLEQAAGPMGGVLKNVLVGKNMIDEGHTWRGVETMLPKALKDVMKAGRYATQGVNTLRGDPLLEDTSLYTALLQLNGFSAAEVAEQYERNRDLTNYEKHITDRRQHLMDGFAMAIRTGDNAARAALLERVTKFNQANPEVAISSASIRASIQSRARYSAKAENGVVINPKLAARLRATASGE